MAGITTKKFRLHNAKQFKEQLAEAENENIYFFIAKSTPWSDDNTPPTPQDKVDTHYDIWNNILSMKKVTNTDVTFALSRVNWTSGSKYDQYTSNTAFQDEANNFYVMTDSYNVYKCIYNNNNANSTSEPTGTSNTIISLADGYKWKYMYSITAAEALKFVTTNYIPVKYLTSDDGTAHWDVQQSAANGAIDLITISDGGSNYKGDSGTLASVTNSSVVVLAASANTQDDIYVGSDIFLTGGTGSGQLRRIIDYVGSSKTATVNNAFSVTPDTSTTYNVGPRLRILGDGANAQAYAVATAGAIANVVVINASSNYSYANVSAHANTGSGAVLVAQIAPYGGHGANAVSELYGHNVMFNVKLTGAESNTVMIANDYRIIGLIANPKLANGSLATGSSYRQTTKLTLTSANGTFTADEIIVGSTSSANAYVVEYITNTVISVTQSNGTFSNTETITGSSSGATAVINGIETPPIMKFSGDMLYLEHRTPVSHGSDIILDNKIVIKF